MSCVKNIHYKLKKKNFFLLFSYTVEILYKAKPTKHLTGLRFINTGSTFKFLSYKSCRGKNKRLFYILLVLFTDVNKLVKSSITLPDYLKEITISTLLLAGSTSAEGMLKKIRLRL